MISPTVLQLSWDDMFATYGGIQTQVRVLMERQGAGYGRTLARVLPTLHAAQVRSKASTNNLSLHTIEEELELLVYRENVGIIHSHNIHRPEGIGVAETVVNSIVRLNVPHVTTVHDLIELHQAQEVAREADLLRPTIRVATSEYNSSALSRSMGLTSVVITPCLTSATDFPSLPKSEAPLLTIAAPGRLLPNKGLTEAVIISGHISRELGPLRILLSSRAHAHNGGNDQYLAELERVAACFPHLTLSFFEGAQAYPNMYRTANLVLCLPRAQEGFGLIPLESVAAGTPVIVIPNCGLEWVKTYPSSIIAMPRNYVRIARQARDMLTNPMDWNEVVKQDQSAIIQAFGAKKMLEAYERLYTE